MSIASVERVLDRVLLLQTPPAKAPCTGFFAQVDRQFKDTNTTIPGILAPPGLSLLTARAASNVTGLPTLGDLAVESYQAGRLTASIEFATYLSVINFLLTGAAFEAGSYVGSMAYVAYDRAANGNPSGASCTAGP